jgi:hypothetical protein
MRADDVQSQAEALLAVLSVARSKPLEDPAAIGLSDPDAPVFDLQRGGLLVAAQADGNGPARAVFQGV